MRRAHALSTSLLLLIGSSAAILRAQGTEADKEAATKLFEDGVKKMQEGKCNELPIASEPACREALDLFRKAYGLYPALGALRNLAFVERGLGMLASASRDFRELARLAVTDPRPDRQEWAARAREEVEKLAPRVPKLLVVVPPGHPQATLVRVDGQLLDAARWGQPIEVDPGDHVVECDASERKHFRAQIKANEGSTVRVDIVLDPTAGPGVPARSAPRAADAGPSRAPPLILTGLGAAGVVVGLGFGWASWDKKKEACSGSDGLCDPATIDRGRRLGNLSTIITATGAIVTATGITWWLLSPSGSKDHAVGVVPAVGAAGGGLSITGWWR